MYAQYSLTEGRSRKIKLFKINKYINSSNWKKEQRWEFSHLVIHGKHAFSIIWTLLFKIEK